MKEIYSLIGLIILIQIIHYLMFRDLRKSTVRRSKELLLLIRSLDQASFAEISKIKRAVSMKGKRK